MAGGANRCDAQTQAFLKVPPPLLPCFPPLRLVRFGFCLHARAPLLTPWVEKRGRVDLLLGARVTQRAASAQFNNCLPNAVQDNKLSEHATQLAAVGVVDMSSLEQLCESASAVEVWQQTDLRSTEWCIGGRWACKSSLLSPSLPLSLSLYLSLSPCFDPKPLTLCCPPPFCRTSKASG
jgi:hypothetical protein